MNDDQPILTSYDRIPYPSHAFPQTHPDRLASVAQLFGMRPERIDRCRVLELGCASGGNLIPLAESFPKSEWIGIDLSSRQVAEGSGSIAELDLKNIRLLAMDILDVDEKLGDFDYILCHGIYSWVPRPVQDGIMAVCQKRLRPQGVAYISYNTYPGWRMRQMIRDMMCYHSQRFSQAEQRIRESRALLDFLTKAAASEKSAYSILLQTELNLLSRCSDSYLFHEHLEDVNEPLYFHEFVQRARQHHLEYLGEADAASMWTGNLPASVRETILAASSEAIQLEQYMDFVRNRTFRQTLLCHDSVRPDRQLTPDRMHSFYVAAPIKATQTRIHLHDSKEELFLFGDSGHSISTSDAIIKAALVRLAESWPKWVHFEQLFAESCSLLKLSPVQDAAAMQRMAENLAGTLLQCFAQGYLELHTVPPCFTLQPGERPRSSRTALRQARIAGSITSQRHETVNVAGIARLILQLLDGSRTRAQLVGQLRRLVEEKAITLQVPSSADADSAQVLERTLDEQLRSLSRAALLVE